MHAARVQATPGGIETTQKVVRDVWEQYGTSNRSPEEK